MTLNEQLKRHTAWWERKNHDRPIFYLAVACAPTTDLNRFWPAPDSEPDLTGMVATQLQDLAQVRFLGELYPCVSHCWGGRGTPMTMAAYLGGRVRFGETTVWVDPVVADWEGFRIAFDPANVWVQRSHRLLETHVKLCPDGCLPVLPDLGDALTVFSLLRGTERLLMDLLEQPAIIEQKIREYVAVWIEAHRYFWDIYRTRFPGDCSALIWAPGKTYICQSDFSTMISPAMFRRLVVPEIEALGRYLEYLPWHLDGPEEIKHLDILLELPQIRAIQIQPGANRPPCASALWLPQAKKIQAKGRSLIVYANTLAELETLMANLAPEGLCLGIYCPFTDLEQTAILKALERRYGALALE